jgi:hypothetical protein
MTKQCIKCGQSKNIKEFFVRSDNGKINNTCKSCSAKYYQKYNKENEKEIKKNGKIYYDNNKNKIYQNKKRYYEDNKEQILTDAKLYYENNREILLPKHRQYYEENKNQLLEDKKIYYVENREKILKYGKQYVKERRKYDHAFALRLDVSTIIGRALKLNDSSKSNFSIFDFLPYNFEELRIHLESQFEAWMTWNNRGKYNAKMWDDNDPYTWRWQLDHIIPHSNFKYTSMDSKEFQECWKLSNLRPLSAKQNIMDGVSRKRHIVGLS